MDMTVEGVKGMEGNASRSLLRSPYFLTSIYLYINFFVHGIGVITIAQNMNYLSARYATDAAGVMYVMSGMGLGRFFSYFLASFFAERFGRKTMVLSGIVVYVLFFAGILLSTNIYAAFAFAILGGVANAFLDVGTYPALMEAHPKTTGTAVIFCKAAISFGQMFYPFVVGFLLINELWFGYGIILPAAILLINALLIKIAPFPKINQKDGVKELPVMKKKPIVFIDGALVILFGYAIYSTFHIALIWLPKFSQQVVGMSEVLALQTVSYYSIGSLVCVFLLGLLVSKFLRPVFVMTIFPAIAASAALVIYNYPSAIVCNVGAFVIGFTAAGGILQLGLSVLNELFSKNKANMTGVYMLFGSLANFSIPVISAKIYTIDIKYIMLFDAGMALLACILGFVIFLRYYSIFSIKSSDLRLGERLFVKPNRAN